MLASRNLHKKSFNSLSSLLHRSHSKNALIPKAFSSNAVLPSDRSRSEGSSPAILVPFETRRREMSSWQPRGPPIGRSMRSKVERRMQNETGKTMREVRRAKKIQKKLMTENERLVFNLKRAKKKVAVLLQKLKKYELPDLPQPVHDPELLTPEQLQAYKKIGFKNKNYVPVGVRGVFGGVVQNMHMHWKFHETVQVCCDNFPKEKIKEMASIIARLSGGVVVNIHKVKTIIMFRGRNYRQPKNLIPLNTLTKRKALFKARFDQALESQKLNVKKIEQQLRRSGINPEDPAASASIQRVASSFFNAIDNRDGTPYVFRSTDLSLDDHGGGSDDLESLEPSDEREKAELDRFIADIEDAAEREWADEEAMEKQKEMEMGERLMYRNKEQFGGRYRRTRDDGGEDYDDHDRVLRRDRNRINNDRLTRDRPGEESGDSDDDDDDGGSYGRDRIAQRERGTIVPYDQRGDRSENQMSGRRRRADEEFDSGDSCSEDDDDDDEDIDEGDFKSDSDDSDD